MEPELLHGQSPLRKTPKWESSHGLPRFNSFVYFMNAPHGASYKNSESLHAVVHPEVKVQSPVRFYVCFTLTVVSLCLYFFFSVLTIFFIFTVRLVRINTELVVRCFRAAVWWPSAARQVGSVLWVQVLTRLPPPPADPQTHRGRSSAAGAACDLSCGSVQSAESPPQPLYKR